MIPPCDGDCSISSFAFGRGGGAAEVVERCHHHSTPQKKGRKECFDDTPPHASDDFETDSAPFPTHLFSLLVRPVHVDGIVNASLSRILFFNLAACSGKYSLFSGSCNRRFGGGLSLKHSQAGKMLLTTIAYLLSKYCNRMEILPVEQSGF